MMRRVRASRTKSVPRECPGLYSDCHIVEDVEQAAPALSPGQEAGIKAALESYRQGRVVDAKRARQIIDATLGR
jgi:hypothetical protein